MTRKLSAHLREHARVDVFFERERLQRTIWAGAKIFETRIRKNIRLAEAPSFGQSILEYAPSSNGAVDYRALAEEVHNMQIDVSDLRSEVKRAA